MVSNHFFCFAFINIKRSIVKSFVVRQIYIYSICNILSWNIACCLITFQKSRKVYCSDWSRWLISVVWVVRVARVVPIVFPEPVDTFSHRDFENWTPTRKVSHQCCETMEPMLETMEQTHKTLTTQNGFSRHFVVLHIQPISHWTIQLAIIIKTITIIAIHGMIQLTIN